MNEGVNGSKNTNPVEKGQVAAGAHVGPVDKNGTYKASSLYGRSDSKTLAQDFLKKHNIQ